MNWLNYHHLNYFYVIAREGSIAKAAEKLRIGQPALSMQLKQLEEQMGRPLFERKNRKLILTESGRTALEYAKEIFRLGDEMQEAIQDRLVAASRTHLQVGALDSVPKPYILSLSKLALSYGNCSVSILEGKGDELLRELMAHRIDVLLSNYPPAIREDQKIYSRSVAKLPVAIYGTKKYLGLKKNFPNSLQGQPFVLPTLHSRLRHEIEHFLKLRSIQIDPIAETQDTSLQQIFGLEGLGLLPLPESLGKNYVKTKQLELLGRLEAVQEELWLISATRKIENPIAARLMRDFDSSFLLK